MKEFYSVKIIDILNSKNVTLSFEVFPPKTEEILETAQKNAAAIASLVPDFMSVTYGAGGGTSDFTVHIAKALKSDCHMEVLPHLTCVSSTKEKVQAMLERFKAAGFENIMALCGDMPQDGTVCTDYTHASELVEHIKQFDSSMCIGGACYPDGHCECARKEEDIRNLKYKIDAGVDFLTTQMFFDNAVFYNFLYRLREAGIDVPVLAGIMPITNTKILGRSVAMSGTTVPARYKAITDRFGDSPEAMKQAGIIYASEQIIDLVANGIKHIHVYSMNRPDVAAAIMANVRPVVDYCNAK